MGLKEASCTHSFDLFFPESLSKGCSFFGGMSFHPFRKVTSNESNTSIFMAYQSQYGVGVHVGGVLNIPHHWTAGFHAVSLWSFQPSFRETWNFQVTQVQNDSPIFPGGVRGLVTQPSVVKNYSHATNKSQKKTTNYHLGVSKNRGTQKWMVYNGQPY